MKVDSAEIEKKISDRFQPVVEKKFAWSFRVQAKTQFPIDEEEIILHCIVQSGHTKENGTEVISNVMLNKLWFWLIAYKLLP